MPRILKQNVWYSGHKGMIALVPYNGDPKTGHVRFSNGPNLGYFSMGSKNRIKSPVLNGPILDPHCIPVAQTRAKDNMRHVDS